MVDPDELMAELEAEQDVIRELLVRLKEQREDIVELQNELDKLSEDIMDDTISSESEPA